MAAKAVIGALRIDLGLNSAQFSKGLKDAQAGLGKFGKAATIGFAAVVAGAAAATAALAPMIKASIDHADALAKAAQKAGTTVEALSRLEYAAKLSDVSLEGLTGGLQKLAKTMADALVTPTSSAATAFKALGIELKNTDGTLRNSDAVFADIADRFSRLEDGSTKTALAMQMFGKSGAEMIPLLNSGRQGLKDMADEADRLGATISTKTAKAAERFNDTWTTINVTMQGVVNKIMEAVLPSLQDFADVLASPKFAEAATQMANGVVTALTVIADFISGLMKMLDDLLGKVNEGVARVNATPQQKSIEKLKADIAQRQGWLDNNQPGDWWNPFSHGQSVSNPEKVRREIEAMQAELANRTAFAGMSPGTMPFALSDNGMGIPGNSGTTPANNNTPLTLPPIFTPAAREEIKKTVEAIDPFAARIQELAGVLTETVDPFTKMKTDLTDLQTMFEHGRISADQFGSAVQKTIAGAVGSFADLAGSALSSLSQIFKENKAIAVASAVVNGIGSVAKTLETYGVTPWGLAAAGVAATTAAANVASILSTTEATKSMPGGVAAPAAAATPAGAALNITLRGSGSINIDELADQLAASVADGGQQPLINVIRERAA
jgi:hypothetical protein